MREYAAVIIISYAQRGQPLFAEDSHQSFCIDSTDNFIYGTSLSMAVAFSASVPTIKTNYTMHLTGLP